MTDDDDIIEVEEAIDEEEAIESDQLDRGRVARPTDEPDQRKV